MRKYLSVEVEHTRYARFLPLDQAGEKRISLTTLADYQKRAEVKIFLINEDQRILLHVFEVERLPKKQAGEPRLVLTGTYDGKGNVRLSISVDGRHYSSASISIKKYTRDRLWWPWILLAALLLLGASAWLVLRSCATTGLPSGPSEPATSEPAATTSAEPRSEADEPAAQPPAQSSEQTAAEPESAAAVQETEDAAAAADQDDEQQPAADRKAVDLSQRVYFGPNSAELTSEARRTLAGFVEELEDYEQLKLSIEGHCALYGTEQGREELSYDRAQRVAQYFRELGYRFDEEPVIRGRAGEEPVSRNNDEQHLNRRVEISTIQPDEDSSG